MVLRKKKSSGNPLLLRRATSGQTDLRSVSGPSEALQHRMSLDHNLEQHTQRRNPKLKRKGLGNLSDYSGQNIKSVHAQTQIVVDVSEQSLPRPRTRSRASSVSYPSSWNLISGKGDDSVSNKQLDDGNSRSEIIKEITFQAPKKYTVPKRETSSMRVAQTQTNLQHQTKVNDNPLTENLSQDLQQNLKIIEMDKIDWEDNQEVLMNQRVYSGETHDRDRRSECFCCECSTEKPISSEKRKKKNYGGYTPSDLSDNLDNSESVCVYKISSHRLRKIEHISHPPDLKSNPQPLKDQYVSDGDEECDESGKTQWDDNWRLKVPTRSEMKCFEEMVDRDICCMGCPIKKIKYHCAYDDGEEKSDYDSSEEFENASVDKHQISKFDTVPENRNSKLKYKSREAYRDPHRKKKTCKCVETQTNFRPDIRNRSKVIHNQRNNSGRPQKDVSQHFDRLKDSSNYSDGVHPPSRGVTRYYRTEKSEADDHRTLRTNSRKNSRHKIEKTISEESLYQVDSENEQIGCKCQCPECIQTKCLDFTSKRELLQNYKGQRRSTASNPDNHYKKPEYFENETQKRYVNRKFNESQPDVMKTQKKLQNTSSKTSVANSHLQEIISENSVDQLFNDNSKNNEKLVEMINRGIQCNLNCPHCGKTIDSISNTPNITIKNKTINRFPEELKIQDATTSNKTKNRFPEELKKQDATTSKTLRKNATVKENAVNNTPLLQNIKNKNKIKENLKVASRKLSERSSVRNYPRGSSVSRHASKNVHEQRKFSTHLYSPSACNQRQEYIPCSQPNPWEQPNYCEIIDACHPCGGVSASPGYISRCCRNICGLIGNHFSGYNYCQPLINKSRDDKTDLGEVIGTLHKTLVGIQQEEKSDFKKLESTPNSTIRDNQELGQREINQNSNSYPLIYTENRYCSGGGNPNEEHTRTSNNSELIQSLSQLLHMVISLKNSTHSCRQYCTISQNHSHYTGIPEKTSQNFENFQKIKVCSGISIKGSKNQTDLRRINDISRQRGQSEQTELSLNCSDHFRDNSDCGLSFCRGRDQSEINSKRQLRHQEHEHNRSSPVKAELDSRLFPCYNINKREKLILESNHQQQNQELSKITAKKDEEEHKNTLNYRNNATNLESKRVSYIHKKSEEKLHKLNGRKPKWLDLFKLTNDETKQSHEKVVMEHNRRDSTNGESNYEAQFSADNHSRDNDVKILYDCSHKFSNHGSNDVISDGSCDLEVIERQNNFHSMMK